MSAARFKMLLWMYKCTFFLPTKIESIESEKRERTMKNGNKIYWLQICLTNETQKLYERMGKMQAIMFY